MRQSACWRLIRLSLSLRLDNDHGLVAAAFCLYPNMLDKQRNLLLHKDDKTIPFRTKAWSLCRFERSEKSQGTA